MCKKRPYMHVRACVRKYVCGCMCVGECVCMCVSGFFIWVLLGGIPPSPVGKTLWSCVCVPKKAMVVSDKG